MVCCSAHKTLPCLTGGAYLHVFNERFAKNAPAAMKPFASTSPSYLTLQSLDYLNKTAASEQFKANLAAATKKTAQLKTEFGIDTKEPLKICFKPGNGYREVFAKHKIVPEIMSDELIVMMFSAYSTDSDFEAVRQALSDIEIHAAKKGQKIKFIYTEYRGGINETCLRYSE
jgi:arginine/lysine/ornithine decarboxylase